MPQESLKVKDLAASVPAARVYEHKHGSGETYLFSCKACRQEDEKRSKLDNKQVQYEDMERVTFLVPPGYDGDICRAYLQEKYPDAVYIGSSLDLSQLPGWAENECVIVCRRDTWPKQPGPGYERTKDKEDKWVTAEVPASTYIADVVEMAPLYVKQCLVYTQKANRFEKAKLDIGGFIRRIAELFPVPYRPDMPRHEKDTVMYIVRA
jgi:hypothetical protein